jgi:hypothetical protein
MVDLLPIMIIKHTNTRILDKDKNYYKFCKVKLDN